MILNFFTSISVVSFFLSSILALFFLFTDRGNKRKNRILALLLFVFGLQVVYSFTTSNYTYQHYLSYHKILYLIRQSSFITGPLILLYIKADTLNRFRAVQLWHLLPFSGAILFLLVYYSKTEKFIIWQEPFELIDTILILISNLIYLVISYLNIRKQNTSGKSIFQIFKEATHVSWLHFILLGFIVIWIVNLNSFAIIMLTGNVGWCAYTSSIFALIVFLFTMALVFISLLKPEIFYSKQKYRNTSPGNVAELQYKKIIEDYFAVQKPYLNPDISLETVSNDLSINSRVLSQIINKYYGCNFNSFINSFRIKESEKQLSETGSNKTVLEILFDSGFNSKSVFYSEFKKKYGCSPKEYRDGRKQVNSRNFSFANN